MPEYERKTRSAQTATTATATRAPMRPTFHHATPSAGTPRSNDHLQTLQTALNRTPVIQAVVQLGEALNRRRSTGVPDDLVGESPVLHTGANGARSDGNGYGIMQRKLAPGLPPRTPVVHHEDAGDVSGYSIVKRTFTGSYNIEGPASFKNISVSDPAWGTEDAKVESRRAWEESKRARESRAAEENLRRQLIVGENYLSADYRRINPLLAALEKQGYTAAQVRSRDFDYSGKADAVLADMRAIAVDRKYADSEMAKAWTLDDLAMIYQMLRTLLGVWDRFSVPTGAGDERYLKVYRGDGRFLYDSFPQLNPARPENAYREGTNDVSFDVVMPGFLSTTYGDPRTHNYVKGKTIVWDLTLPAGHEGKALGQNNPSEKEMTFPIGTTLKVHTLLVRLKDKTQEAATYGPDAEVVVKATVLGKA